jgi:hypothetical protein
MTCKLGQINHEDTKSQSNLKNLGVFVTWR